MDTKREITRLTEWIAQYVKDAGKDGVVIGLSGGVDSAVSFELAIKALGKENVLGVSLPILTNTDEQFTDTSDVWSYCYEKRGVEHQTIQMSSVALDFMSKTSKAQDKWGEGNSVSQLTYANIQARSRMTMLYALAQERNYLVIGTGNKSEHKIGYFTKWGDGAVDFEPLGDYYKHEVYELAKALYVPKFILNAAPSAGLWEGQTDEDELGVTYEQLDSFLQWHERPVAVGECPIDDPKIVKRIYQLMNAAKHKNILPPIYRRD